MEYRRLFIIRKDLNMSAGKLSAMVGHCAEAYWTRLISNNALPHMKSLNNTDDYDTYSVSFDISREIFEGYIKGIFTKTICEAKNLNHLNKAAAIAIELGLKEDIDYGFINDKCLTELTPENEDGTCTVGIWFRPLDTETAHKISKKYQLYK